MNYVDVDFIQKELKERVAADNESHYAEVVSQNKPPMVKPPMSPTSTDETLYRLLSDHKVEKLKLLAKVGDIFLSKEQEKNGFIKGTLLQVSPKNNHHSNVTLPLVKLVPYTPVLPRLPLLSSTSLSSPGLPQSPKPKNPVYVDMNDLKSPKKDLETFTGFFNDFSGKPLPQVPVLPAPSRDKSKLLAKQKLSKLKSDFKYLDCEVPVFAVCDRKSSNKEKEVLTFKQKQLGVLVFSSTMGWWLIKMMDGTTTSLGWVPRDFWRIMPESMEDDYSNCSYSPWLFNESDVTELEKKLLADGDDRNFLFVYDKNEQCYTLLVKCNGVVHSFAVNILPADNQLVFSGKYFQTLDNLVLYFKRVSFSATGVDCTLGSPFKND